MKGVTSGPTISLPSRPFARHRRTRGTQSTHTTALRVSESVRWFNATIERPLCHGRSPAVKARRTQPIPLCPEAVVVSSFGGWPWSVARRAQLPSSWCVTQRHAAHNRLPAARGWHRGWAVPCARGNRSHQCSREGTMRACCPAAERWLGDMSAAEWWDTICLTTPSKLPSPANSVKSSSHRPLTLPRLPLCTGPGGSQVAREVPVSGGRLPAV